MEFKKLIQGMKEKEDLEDKKFEDWTDDKFDQELFDNEYIYAGLNKARAAEIMAERLKAPKDKVNAFIEKNFDEHYWDE